jgi:hypothetical protein
MSKLKNEIPIERGNNQKPGLDDALGINFQSSTPNQARDATLVSSEEASEAAVLYDKQFETDIVVLKGLYESL